MRGSGFATTATKGWNCKLKTGRTPSSIAPGPPLLMAWRQVETLVGRPSAPNRFGGWSSEKSQLEEPGLLDDLLAVGG